MMKTFANFVVLSQSAKAQAKIFVYIARIYVFLLAKISISFIRSSNLSSYMVNVLLA